MYTSFGIGNFRCFKDISVQPLARVNLICGENNSGKTTLLEALWLHSGPNSPDLGLRLSNFRGIAGPDPRRFLYDLFRNFDPLQTITLFANGDWNEYARILHINSQQRNNDVFIPQVPEDQNLVVGTTRGANVSSVSNTEIVLDYKDEFGDGFLSTGRWEISEAPPTEGSHIFPVVLTSQGMLMNRANMPPRPSSVFLAARSLIPPFADVSGFGEAELEGYAERILNCLRSVDPQIRRLLTVAAPPGPMVYVDIGLPRPVPMGFLGDGIGRLLNMALSFKTASNGMMLIDEVENGLHHNAMKSVWENLDWLSREFNVQIFATTHSYECLVAARDAFKSAEQDELHVHRLDRRDGLVASTTYSFEALDFTLDYGAELR